MSERTLVLIKPDGVARGLVGEVLGRIERKGFTIVAMELRTLTVEVAEAHYGEHKDKPLLRRPRRLHHRRPARGRRHRGPRRDRAVAQP